MTSAEAPGINNLLKPLDKSTAGDGVTSVSNDYLAFYDQNGNNDETEKRRKEEAMVVNNTYYDLATDFYEYGWGESFHFGALRPEESREHSFAKHEYYLALKMALKRGMRVLVWLNSSIFKLVLKTKTTGQLHGHLSSYLNMMYVPKKS